MHEKMIAHLARSNCVSTAYHQKFFCGFKAQLSKKSWQACIVHMLGAEVSHKSALKTKAFKIFNDMPNCKQKWE